MIDISRPHYSAVRAAVVLISLTLCACDSAGAGTGAYPADTGDLGLIQDAMKQVEKNYVAPVTGGELAKDALKGMLTRLDPHSDYMDQEQYQQMAAVTRGQFGGIGVAPQRDPRRLRQIGPQAEQHRLRPHYHLYREYRFRARRRDREDEGADA